MPVIGGLVLVVAGAGFTVLMAVLFNLISGDWWCPFTVVGKTARLGRSDFVPAADAGSGCRRRSASARRGAAPAMASEPSVEVAESAPGEDVRARTPPDSSAPTSPSDPSRRRVGCRFRNDGPDDGVVNGDDDRVVGRTGL